jgi:hypothetical protein
MNRTEINQIHERAEAAKAPEAVALMQRCDEKSVVRRGVTV